MAGFGNRVLAALGVALPRMAGSLLSGLVAALTAPLEEADTLLTPAAGGWPTMLDLNTTTQPAWLAQLAGVRVDTTASLAAQRSAILAHPMWKRGTPAAVIGLAQQFLTGTKRVDLYERDGGDAWKLRVRVYQVQFADPSTTTANIAAALAATKPIGIALTVEAFPGATYAIVNTNEASYAALQAAVATYNDMLTIL